jgi:hypothetical protein
LPRPSWLAGCYGSWSLSCTCVYDHWTCVWLLLLFKWLLKISCIFLGFGLLIFLFTDMLSDMIVNNPIIRVIYQIYSGCFKF